MARLLVDEGDDVTIVCLGDDAIPLLTEFFMGRMCERLGREIPEIEPSTLYHLYHYDWPGNIRELENEIERLTALASEVITTDLMSPNVAGGKEQAREGIPRGTLKEIIGSATEGLERQVIMTTLRDLEWNKSQTSKKLGISRPTLDQKIEKYSLKRPPKDAKNG